MKEWLGKGWNMTLRHKYVGVLIFLYRLLWGFFLFRLIDTVVTPVLARYPDLHPNSDAIPLFLIEAEFRLLRTGMLDSLLWLLLGLLCIRMIITPIINAGLYYSFYHAEEGKNGTRVVNGIRRVWKPVILLYAVEHAVLLLPAWWVLPLARNLVYSTGIGMHAMQELLPYAVGWLIWGFAVRLVFRCLQFGVAAGRGLKAGFTWALQRAFPLLAVTLMMAGIGLAASAAVSAVTLIGSGFIAVLIHQASHFIRSILSLWTAASQFSVWKERES